jgi:ribonuclease T1
MDLPTRAPRLARILLVLAAFLGPVFAGASATPAPLLLADAGMRVSLDSYPAEERSAIEKTLALIDAGGPFPYRQDGAVFSNREHLLPAAPHGYYHEYTVPTPGSYDRGARRIVMGSQSEAYYTDDHYRSFWRIR